MMRTPLSTIMNFAGRDYRLASRLVAGLSAAGAVLFLMVIIMVGTALSLRSRAALLEQEAAELQARVEQVRPALEERDRLLRDLGAMSGLVEARRFSWTRLLTEIEKAFPTGAATEKLRYDPKDRSLLLEGRAQSPEALRNIMVGFERSPSFADPLLKKQSVEDGVLSFTVGASYR